MYCMHLDVARRRDEKRRAVFGSQPFLFVFRMQRQQQPQQRQPSRQERQERYTHDFLQFVERTANPVNKKETEANLLAALGALDSASPPMLLDDITSGFKTAHMVVQRDAGLKNERMNLIAGLKCGFSRCLQAFSSVLQVPFGAAE